ncbi:hypothetical protein ACIRP0_06075 [Streptomyces sp. NPDC101733]|uniref:hypothetical protein n=1 Tax=unclassified Streptomyces TaxID=2593676 RepID=UPI0037FA234F
MTHQRGLGTPGFGADSTARARVGDAWDSALSYEEFAAVKGVGFDPVGQVLGTAVFDIGYSGTLVCPGAWSVPEGAKTPSSPWTSTLAQSVRTLYAARGLALSRAVAECASLGGDGIVGVELDVGEFPGGGTEFTVRATAVRARSRVRPHRPFTSHLSGQDFARLVHAGWIPTGLAFGIALVTRHDDWRDSRRIPWTAGNQEVDGHTRLLTHARRDARERLALEAAKNGGDGVVVDEVGSSVSESECFSFGHARDLTAEAVFVGTSVIRFGRTAPPVGTGPLTIMRLERER